MKFDLHIHSVYSDDSILPVDMLLRAAASAGLDGVAVADHNTIEGSRAAGKAGGDILVIPAAEYSTDAGHLLALFLREGLENAGIDRNEKGLYKADELSGAAREQGALIFSAHPFAGGGLYEKADGIEVYNGRAAVGRNRGANAEAAAAAKRLNKPYSAGSDAHFAAEIGTAHIELDCAPALSDIKAALLRGGGRVFGQAWRLSYRAQSSIIKMYEKKNYKRLLKYLAQYPAFLALDLLRAAKIAHPIENFEFINDITGENE